MEQEQKKETENRELPVNELIREALIAREKAYTPYSHFRVGAALLTEKGQIYTGCNIENAAFGPTICAERCAIFKAVSDGECSFTAIAIAGGREEEKDAMSGFAYPCGVCRQVMREFAVEDNFIVIVARSTENYQIFSLQELLPKGFGSENL